MSKWNAELETRRQLIGGLLEKAGIEPSTPEVFRLDKTKGYIKNNVAVARLDVLLAMGEEDFDEVYSSIIQGLPLS